MIWQIFIAVSILSYLIFRSRNKEIFNLAKQLPSQFRYVPFIGHSWLLFRKGKDPMDFIKDIGDEANNNNGISSIWLANHLYVVLTEPNDMEKVLLNCLEKDDVVRLAEPLLHNSSLISSASLWRPRRKILVSVFGQKLLNNFVNIFQKQSGILLNELKALGEMNNLPIFKYLSSCTMGALCESTLGVNVNSKNNINHPFVPAFHKFCEDTLFRFCNPLLHSITIFKMMPSYSKYIENINVLIDFTDELIKLKRQEISKGNDSIQTHASGDNVKGKSALELLLMTSGPDNNYTDVELREELLTAILAGTDTSAVGASFVLLMLAKYPDIQEKVFQEIMYIRKNGDNTIDAEDLPRLVYLDAVIKETLRLYPPVPSISRKIMKHVTLPSGITLPPGVGVLANIWGLHRNPEIWGPDVLEFKPERFINNPPTHPVAFIPFSYGQRNCLGFKYAMLSMKTTLSSVIRNFRILTVDKSESSTKPLNVKWAVFLKHAENFEIQMQRRISV